MAGSLSLDPHPVTAKPATLSLSASSFHRRCSASGQRSCSNRKPHPERRRQSLTCSCRREAGACRISLPAREAKSAGSECVRGHFHETPRPQEQGRRACGTERVTGPAHFVRAPDRHPYGPRPWAWFAKRIEQVARRAAQFVSLSISIRSTAPILARKARIFPNIVCVADFSVAVVFAFFVDQHGHLPPICQTQSLFVDG